MPLHSCSSGLIFSIRGNQSCYDLKTKMQAAKQGIKKYQYLSSISLIELNFCYTINFRSVISLKTDRIIEMLYEL